jgi:hypothetical protein
MRLVLRAAAIGLMVAMAAACGSGGESNANQPNQPNQPNASSSKPAEKPVQPADKGGDGSAYCDKVHELGDSYDPMSTLAQAQSDPNGVEALKQLANIYVELAKVAPGEIKAELEGSRDLFLKVVDATASGKTSDPALEAQAPKVAEWGVKIQEYTVKHCA